MPSNAMPRTFTETKRNLAKPDQTFICQLLYHGGNRVILSYLSDRPWTFQMASVSIPAGTLTLAYYQEELPYILWKLVGPDEHLIGYYIHLCDNVHIGDDTVAYRDLLLDVWFFPDGSYRLLDEDELAAVQAAGLLDTATAVRIRQQATDLIERFPALRNWFDQLLSDVQKSA